MTFERLEDSCCCPNCGEKLHLEDQEYDVGDILETVSCDECGKEYEIQFIPVKITELKDNE